jgi:hypothetical protein
VRPNLCLTPEASLLFRCARGRPDPDAVRASIRGGIDWHSFLSLSEEHHLRGLCLRRLETICPKLVPPEVLESLRPHFRRNVERNLFLTGELFRILEHLEKCSVPALAFKGPVLAWWLYDHPGLREFQDLDILVNERDLPRACASLEALEYHADTGRSGNTKIVSSGGQMSLLRANPMAVVDLHWELAPCAMGLGYNSASVLPRAQLVPLTGRLVPTFGAEDQILFCALHGGKHGWAKLAWLADLSALIENRPPDWTRLLEDARRMRLSRALHSALWLAWDLLGTPLPAQVWRVLERDIPSAVLARDLAASLWSDRQTGLFPPGLRCEFQLTEGLGRKAQFLWSRITEPSSEDWEMRRTARPFRLMKKYALLLAGAR